MTDSFATRSVPLFKRMDKRSYTDAVSGIGVGKFTFAIASVASVYLRDI